MNITLEFWENGNARIVHSYRIMTDPSGVENHDEKFIARFRPASSNLAAGEGFRPAWGSSDIEVKDRAVSAIRGCPEYAGLRSFEKMARARGQERRRGSGNIRSPDVSGRRGPRGGEVISEEEVTGWPCPSV